MSAPVRRRLRQQQDSGSRGFAAVQTVLNEVGGYRYLMDPNAVEKATVENDDEFEE